MKIIKTGFFCLFVSASFGTSLSNGLNASERNSFTDVNEKISYSIGVQVGGDLKRQGVDINAEAMLKGVLDAVDGNSTVMTKEDMRQTLVDFKTKIIDEERNSKRVKSEVMLVKGQNFLDENSRYKDVISLSSGLQYKIIKKGDGKTPKIEDNVTVHYVGKLIDGEEFDSTLKKKPATFRVNSVIPGWTQALQMMKEGDKWELFIPPTLAYNNKGPLANRTLILEVELIKVGSL